MSKAENSIALDIEAQAADWLARTDRGLSPTEDAAFQAWLDQDLKHRVEWLRLSSVWERADRLSALRAPASRRPTRCRIGLPSFAPKGWQVAAAAAVVAVVLTAGGGAAKTFLWGETFATPVGGRVVEPLADGSRVELNTDTRARFAVNALQRRVWLERGEAYFDVRRDPSRPFVVAAGDVRISVLGTAFTVERDEAHVVVRVTEGMVQVRQGEQVVSARPGDEVLIRDGRLHYAHRNLEDIEDALGWRNGRLIFHDRSLGEVAEQFNRYSERKLRVEGAAADIHVGGAFKADNVEEFAAVLERAYGLQVRRHGGEIIISE